VKPRIQNIKFISSLERFSCIKGEKQKKETGISLKEKDKFIHLNGTLPDSRDYGLIIYDYPIVLYLRNNVLLRLQCIGSMTFLLA
jgi:hypothetical protein